MSGKSRRRRLASPFLWALVVLVGLGFFAADRGVQAAAGDQAKPAPPGSPVTKPEKKKSPNDGQPELWDPGDEIDPPRQLTPARGGDKAPGSGAATGGNAAPSNGAPTWSVLLATVRKEEGAQFTREDHNALASALRDRIAKEFPALKDCFVQRVSQGSVILVGRFAAPDDPAAQTKLKEVKSLQAEGKRPFAMAMLTRTATTAAPAGPYDVSHLRERFPTVVPLYSLQVAAWSTFGEKSLSPADIRAAADRYCKELRTKGFEAWVHHDDTTNTSVVVVGHFDHNAYDSKSTLYAPEVEVLMKKFPRHLLNGEEVLVPVDPRDPKGKTKPQGCRLVEVPR